MSIATKIFLAFTVMLVVFSAVLGYTIQQMRQMSDDVELIHSGYGPLTLTMNDVRSDLRSYRAVLSEDDLGVLEKRLKVSRSLYDFPSQIGIKLGRAEAHIGRLYVRSQGEERIFLKEMEGALAEIGQLNRAFGETSDAFAEAVDAGDGEKVRAIQATLRRQQRRLVTEVRGVQQGLREATTRSLRVTHRTESRAFGVVAILSVVALIVSAVMLVVVHMTLRPMSRLTEGVKRVAEGNFGTIDPVHTRDEIGLLSREFNTMALRLSQRDRELRDQADTLVKSERLAAVGEMATKVTHELRNPLSTIRLNAELLLGDLEEGDQDVVESVETLRDIVSEVERLTTLTEEYLRFARLPDSKLEPGDLGALVEGVMEFQRGELVRSGVEVHVQTSEVDVLLDSSQMKRALINLVRNAREAMVDRPKKELTVSVSREEDCAVLVLRDTGCGMSEEEQERVFEPFFSTKGQGTGLGLPLTLQIIEEHDGVLECSSVKGEGTTFLIRLPVYRV